jgi:hypothetical protein
MHIYMIMQMASAFTGINGPAKNLRERMNEDSQPPITGVRNVHTTDVSSRTIHTFNTVTSSYAIFKIRPVVINPVSH